MEICSKRSKVRALYSLLKRIIKEAYSPLLCAQSRPEQVLVNLVIVLRLRPIPSKITNMGIYYLRYQMI